MTYGAVQYSVTLKQEVRDNKFVPQTYIYMYIIYIYYNNIYYILYIEKIDRVSCSVMSNSL